MQTHYTVIVHAESPIVRRTWLRISIFLELYSLIYNCCLYLFRGGDIGAGARMAGGLVALHSIVAIFWKKFFTF